MTSSGRGLNAENFIEPEQHYADPKAGGKVTTNEKVRLIRLD